MAYAHPVCLSWCTRDLTLKAIQKWVGHADINTTLKIYARVKEKEAKQEILDGMNQIIHIKKYDD